MSFLHLDWVHLLNLCLSNEMLSVSKQWLFWLFGEWFWFCSSALLRYVLSLLHGHCICMTHWANKICIWSTVETTGGASASAPAGLEDEADQGPVCAEVKIPAFTRGHCQLEARDVENTRTIAHLRIHVERVIGTVWNKYTILSAKVPINMVLPCEGEEKTFLDKIVSVCCTLTIMSRSVVQSWSWLK